jgi:hypothetical protein
MKEAHSDKSELSHGARFRMDGPGDLLAKLIHDINRIGNAPSKAAAAYATFDAAIAAWSVPDWCMEARRARNENITLYAVRKEMCEVMPELTACEMIANAAKHFRVSNNPIDVYNSVVTFRSKTLDPQTKELVRSTGHLALIFWRDETHQADQFFSRLAAHLREYLFKLQLDSRCTALAAILDDDL